MEERIIEIENQIRVLNAYIHALHSVLMNEAARMSSFRATDPNYVEALRNVEYQRLQEEFQESAREFRLAHG